MKLKERNWTKWLYYFSIAAAVVILYKTIDNLGNITSGIGEFLGILTPFFIGILIAYILYIPSRKVESFFIKQKKIKFLKRRARPISVITVYIIAILLIILLFTFIIPPVAQSIIDLVNNFQQYFNMAVKQIDQMPDDSFIKSQVLTRIVDFVKNIDITQIINIEKISQYAQGAISFFNGIVNTFVALIVSVYILISRKEILNFFKRLAGAIFKKRAYNNLDKYFNRSNDIFFKFLSGQIIDAFVVGILTSIVMSIMGVKYAVLLGFMIGFFNVIPYIGAIIAVAIAAIITFFTGGLNQAITMLIVVIIVQQIDANILNPKIVGNSLKINPLLVLLAITIGGAYFGMLGIFLSVPVAAIIKLLVDDFISYRNRQKVDRETE